MTTTPNQGKPIGYLAEYEMKRLNAGSDANLRSAKFGPSATDNDVPVFLAAGAGEAAPNTIGIQEAWEVAGGNPGIKATREELLEALKQLDEVCDEVADAAASSPTSAQWTPADLAEMDARGAAPATFNMIKPSRTDDETAAVILKFVNRPGETYRGAVYNHLGKGFSAALRRAIEQAAPAVAPEGTPYPNCQFRHCDLPGQCKGEGRCHHPRAEVPAVVLTPEQAYAAWSSVAQPGDGLEPEKIVAFAQAVLLAAQPASSQVKLDSCAASATAGHAGATPADSLYRENVAALIKRMRCYRDSLAPPMARGLMEDAIRVLRAATPTPDAEHPKMSATLAQMTRRIRRCQNEDSAWLLLTHYVIEYARLAGASERHAAKGESA